ncbi:MAG: glycine cleavage system protein GcvH [Candidatus Sericytochromatia bacterium]
MSTYYYTQTHECFRLEDGQAVISITPYAVDQLGEITYVQLPSVGQQLTKGQSFGEIESVKTVSELYAPLSGTVSAVNTALDATPEQINEDPLQVGWLLKVTPADAEQAGADTLDEAAYSAYLDQQA